MITEDQVNRFKEKIRVEKCEGEITEVKLAGFIANYNSNEFSSKIFIENNTIIITPSLMGGGLNIKFTDMESKIRAMLTAMIFVLLNSQQAPIWFR